MGNTRSECKHSVPVSREHATNNAKANGYLKGLLDKMGYNGELYVCPHDSPVSYALMGQGVRIESPARVGNIVCRHCRNPAGFEPIEAKVLPYDEASIDILDEKERETCLRCKYLERTANDALCGKYGQDKPDDAGCKKEAA